MPVFTFSCSLLNRPEMIMLWSRANVHCGRDAARSEGGNSKSGNVHAVHEVEARHLGSHVQLHEAVAQDLGEESQSNAELLVLNGHLRGCTLTRPRLKHRNRYLAAGQECRRILLPASRFGSASVFALPASLQPRGAPSTLLGTEVR